MRYLALVVAVCFNALWIGPQVVRGASSAADAISRAESLASMNLFEDAVTLFAGVVGNGDASDADQARALFGQAMALNKMKNWQRAADAFARFVELAPTDFFGHANYAKSLTQLRRYDEAEREYNVALTLNVRRDNVYNNIGMLMRQAGRPDDAIQAFEDAIVVNPQHAAARKGLGSILLDQGEYFRASVVYAAAQKLMPSDLDVFVGLATSTGLSGNVQQAEDMFAAAVQAAPGLAAPVAARCLVLHKRNEFHSAIKCYTELLQQHPTNAVAVVNIGIVHAAVGQLVEALKYLRAATAEDAVAHADPVAWFNLGLALIQGRLYEEAVSVLEQARILDPLNSAVLCALQVALAELGDWSHDVLVNMTNTMTASGCDGDDPSVLESCHPCTEYFMALYAVDRPELQLFGAQRRAKQLQTSLSMTQHGEQKHVPTLQQPQGGDRLSVAVISCDLGNHAVGHLFSAALPHLPFDTLCFGCGPRGDDSIYRHRIEQSCTTFTDIVDMTDDEIATLVRNKSPTIVLDLMGWTKTGRPALVARPLAHIQVSWLGFPATVGASWLSHATFDTVSTPPEMMHFFSERIVMLPTSFLPLRTELDMVPTDTTALYSRQREGWPSQDSFVFIAFHDAKKINLQTLQLWFRVLSQVPNSVLWLKGTPGLRQQRLMQQARHAGIAEDRLVFTKFETDLSDHFARFARGQIFLDAPNYNAMSTAVEVVSQGLPIVTFPGQSTTSRVASSVLRSLQLTQLVARSSDEYVELAVRLASSPWLLQPMRDTIRSAYSKAADTASLGCSLSTSFHSIVDLAAHDLSNMHIVSSSKCQS